MIMGGNLLLYYSEVNPVTRKQKKKKVKHYA